jgi:glucose/arabinose dehydrogenase
MHPHPKPSRPTTFHPAPALAAATATATAAALALLPASAAETRLNGHLFTHPAGFSIELAADAALIPRPIAGSFDPQGRLYVTDSSGSNLPPSEQLKDPRSRILRLVDANADGRFETATVFADRVMFPQGCLWHNGSVYVAGPPSIWKFTDTDGDGVADKREEWYKGNVLTGCANDVHGPYLGPEGMLYWTKGAFSRLDLKDHRGRTINDRCAHIFRAWADGSGMESILSGGMDNPVEVAFTADAEPVVISTFLDLSQPGRRDGLGHAVYGGVFGKINDVVDEPMVRRTGDLMPVLTQFGPAAACALTQYGAEAFGPDFRHNLFGTLFNLRKVTRHVLRPAGATYTSEDSDFLVSDQIDFRPTDVFEDADGSLLVVDTGGWYKLCCPSSQLAKADVLGGIYRVRRTGAPGLPAAERASAYARLAQPPPQPPTHHTQQNREAPPPSSGKPPPPGPAPWLASSTSSANTPPRPPPTRNPPPWPASPRKASAASGTPPRCRICSRPSPAPGAPTASLNTACSTPCSKSGICPAPGVS